MEGERPLALISGAGGGIGSVTARRFAEAGYALVLTDYDADLLAATAGALTAEGYAVEALALDQRSPQAVAEAFAGLRARYPRLQAAFNNAGVSARRVPLAELAEDDWQRCIDTNLTGTWRLMKEEIRWMLDTGGGAIVNNASVFALHGGPSAAYTASKHGIAGLTKSAAVSYAGRGVRVNAVCPGLIEAGMGLQAMRRWATEGVDPISLHPAGRAGTAEEVAEAVLWLCSPAAGFIHGHLLAIDGGYGSR